MSSPSSPLLAILLVTSSTTGCFLVWSWPPRPQPPLRLLRPLPLDWENEPDISWRAAHDFDQITSNFGPVEREKLTASVASSAKRTHSAEYEWRRTGPSGHETQSGVYTRSSGSRPSSGRNSPSVDGQGTDAPEFRDDYAYGEVLGYAPGFLAEVLSPKPALCHQKFELFIEELAFIGHPVHAQMDGTWGYNETYGLASSHENAVEQLDQRGRPKDRSTTVLEVSDISLSPEMPLINSSSMRERSPRSKRPTNALESFHLVLVLDRPDPSSVSSTDVFKFIDIYYRQIAFKMTAAMHHEQGRVDFVTQQAALLTALKDQCISRDLSFDSYIEQALERSSLADAIRTVFTCISQDKIARVLINDIPVQVQLPLHYISALTEAVDDLDDMQALEESQLEESEYGGDDLQDRWLDELHYGWRLPPMLPWKALLLQDGQGPDMVDDIWIRSPNLDDAADASSKDLLRSFIRAVSPTLSLSDLAALSDWDLQSEVFPMARLLVYNRKAKVIDVIPANLKSFYVPSSQFQRPLADYAQQFAKKFLAPVPPLPSLLSSLSENHQAFRGVIPTPDHRSLFTNVLIWLLQNDLLVLLHVRIRIFASTEVKARIVDIRRKHAVERQAKAGAPMTPRGGKKKLERPASPKLFDLQLNQSSSPETTKQSRWDTSGDRRRTDSDPTLDDDSEEVGVDFDDSDLDDPAAVEESIICDPSRATRVERMWLEAMKDGKDPFVKKMFEKMYVYFDGKKTTEEILYRTDMSKRQLRDVLHHFEDCLITLLHP